MANWCCNTLTVKSNGNKKDLIRFMEQGQNKEIIKDEETLVWRISNYLPIPSEFLKEDLTELEEKNLMEMYGFKNCSDWRDLFWGTDWDCNDYQSKSLTDGESLFEVDFDSAWSPPIEWLISVSVMYPSLSFQLEYIEPGMCFAGLCSVNNGMFMDLCSETVYKNKNGDIIKIIYDDENEQYILPNGEVYDEDGWLDNELSQPKNPFNSFNLI